MSPTRLSLERAPARVDLEPERRHAGKLTRLGLVEARERRSTPELREFLEEYVASRKDVKPATKLVWGLVIADLCQFFGEDCRIDQITPDRAEDFKVFLKARGLAQTTVHKRLNVCRQFFRYAVKAQLLTRNPFEEVRERRGNPRDRQRYVSVDETLRLIQAAPTVDWKVIIALCRFAGLRCPSEVLSLKWTHIDWNRGIMRVPQPKLEHHADKRFREVPIFGAIKPFLEEAFHAPSRRSQYVVANDTYRRRAYASSHGWRNANLRTQFERIVRRAGLEPWPRLFHNLRASLATDLTASFPQHVVAS